MAKEPFMISWQAAAINAVLWLLIVLMVYGAFS